MTCSAGWRSLWWTGSPAAAAQSPPWARSSTRWSHRDCLETHRSRSHHHHRHCRLPGEVGLHQPAERETKSSLSHSYRPRPAHTDLVLCWPTDPLLCWPSNLPRCWPTTVLIHRPTTMLTHWPTAALTHWPTVMSRMIITAGEEERKSKRGKDRTKTWGCDLDEIYELHCIYLHARW